MCEDSLPVVHPACQRRHILSCCMQAAREQGSRSQPQSLLLPARRLLVTFLSLRFFRCQPFCCHFSMLSRQYMCIILTAGHAHLSCSHALASPVCQQPHLAQLYAGGQRAAAQATPSDPPDAAGKKAAGEGLSVTLKAPVLLPCAMLWRLHAPAAASWKGKHISVKL